MWTLIRLLLKEQSDLGPHCLQKRLLKSQTDDKADDNCCDWQFKGYDKKNCNLLIWRYDGKVSFSLVGSAIMICEWK